MALPYQQLTKSAQPEDSPPYSYGQKYRTIPRKENLSPPAIVEFPAVELPAEVPPGLATTRQLNEEKRPAPQLQQLDVDETRQRSSSLSGLKPSTPDLRSSYIKPPHEARAHRWSVSSLVPHSFNSFVRPQSVLSLTPHESKSFLQPQSQVFPAPAPTSPIAPYGPDSIVRPIGLIPSTLPEVVVGPRPASFDQTSSPPPTHTAPSLLPEVVTNLHGNSSGGEPLVEHPTTNLPSVPVDHKLLPLYLEQHRQVPYPPQWRLPPLQATFYGTAVRATRSGSWLDTPTSQQWRTIRFTENARNPTPPSFQIDFKARQSAFVSPKLSWTMSTMKKAHGKWNYRLKMDSNNKTRQSETLAPPKGQSLLTTYVNAPNYDSLRFVGPDGRQYMWVSHAPVSAMHGARYDTLRHALFVATYGNQDPLYGEIVADHAYWDGFVDYKEKHHGKKCESCGASPINGLRWKCKSCPDHDICGSCQDSGASVNPSCFFTLVNLPDETLYIRSRTVDPALVVATLQILKDWEMHTIRWERTNDPKAFALSEASIRKGDLGRIRHWIAEDFDRRGRWRMGEQISGTVAKIKELEEVTREGAAISGDGKGGDEGVIGGGD